jgi:hypothetical protein
VRQHLYENGSGFGSAKGRVRAIALENLQQKIRQIQAPDTSEAIKSQIWIGLVRDGLVPEGAERDTYTVQKADAAAYDVDHIVPLAQHWHESGWNSGDAKRHAIAGSASNLQLLLMSVNRGSGSEGTNARTGASQRYYYVDKFYVGLNFSSDDNNCPPGSLTIKGQPFEVRDEKG